MTISELVVALSGKPKAERAVPVAISLAQSLGWSVRLLTFVEETYDVVAAQQYLRNIQSRMSSEHPEVDCRISVEVEPHAPQGLIRQSTDDCLLVIATSARIVPHGHYIGSAAEAVVRGSKNPTLLVGPKCRWKGPQALERIVVTVDGSDVSEQAVDTAARWGEDLDLPTWVVTAIDLHDRSFVEMPAAQLASSENNYVHRIAEKYLSGRPDGGAPLYWDVLHGNPAAALIGFTDEATLTVMSSHGRTGLARVVVGSITSQFVKNATGPVLVQQARLPDDEGDQ